MSIPKARRGRVGSKSYVIRLNNGRFKDIPKGVYDQLRVETEEREYSEPEIDQMIHAYNMQSNRLQNNVQAIQNGLKQASAQKSPFG